MFSRSHLTKAFKFKFKSLSSPGKGAGRGKRRVRSLDVQVATGVQGRARNLQVSLFSVSQLTPLI